MPEEMAIEITNPLEVVSQKIRQQITLEFSPNSVKLLTEAESIPLYSHGSGHTYLMSKEESDLFQIDISPSQQMNDPGSPTFYWNNESVNSVYESVMDIIHQQEKPFLFTLKPHYNSHNRMTGIAWIKYSQVPHQVHVNYQFSS